MKVTQPPDDFSWVAMDPQVIKGLILLRQIQGQATVFTKQVGGAGPWALGHLGLEKMEVTNIPLMINSYSALGLEIFLGYYIIIFPLINPQWVE